MFQNILQIVNCIHSFNIKNKIESYKKVCGDKDFCNVIMSSEDSELLEFNRYQEADKAPFIIYTDLEYIIEKIDGYKNNPENSSTAKVNEHFPSPFLMLTISSFRSIENRHHDVYRGKDCMKKLCEPLIEHAVKIITFIY